ncbi:MAG: GIY-YIG nuclease family protein, partial [Bacteroidota bacterium]
MPKPGFVYLLASRPNGTLYLGVTSDLVRRAGEHRTGVIDGFSSMYGIRQLVWFERHEDIQDAIVREKRLKKWNRAWKLRLVRESNPTWRDLWDELTSHPGEVAAMPRPRMDSRLRGNDSIGEGGTDAHQLG